MMEKCICCGFTGVTSETTVWTRDNAKRPDVFICDVCRQELIE